MVCNSTTLRSASCFYFSEHYSEEGVLPVMIFGYSNDRYEVVIGWIFGDYLVHFALVREAYFIRLAADDFFMCRGPLFT